MSASQLPQQRLKHRLAKIREQIGSTELVAVTKYSEHSDLSLAYSCGVRDFGENRVEALLAKVSWAQEQQLQDIRWHFIGQLQSNKLTKLFSCRDLVAIHSVERLSILEKMLKHKPAQKIDLYLQVKTSFEDEKAGFDPQGQEFEAALNLLQGDLGNFVFKGLMTMAPIRVDDIASNAAKSFTLLRELRDKIQEKFQDKFPHDLGLSMGMSGDYPEAIKQGATIVRLGSALFDELS